MFIPISVLVAVAFVLLSFFSNNVAALQESRNHNRRLQQVTTPLEFKDSFPQSLIGTWSGSLKVLNVLDKNETVETCLPLISPLIVPHYILFEKNTLGNVTFTDGSNTETFTGNSGSHYSSMDPESYSVIGFNSANGLIKLQFLDDVDGTFQFCKQILAPMTIRTIISMEDSCLPATYKNTPQLSCVTSGVGTIDQMTIYSYTGQYTTAAPSASPSLSPSRSPFPSFDANLFQNLLITKLPVAKPTDMTNALPSFPSGFLEDVPSPGSLISASPSSAQKSFFFPSSSNSKNPNAKFSQASSGASSSTSSTTVMYTLSGGFLLGALLGSRMRFV